MQSQHSDSPLCTEISSFGSLREARKCIEVDAEVVTLAIEVNFESLHTVLESGVEERDLWANISISLEVRHWIRIKSNHLIEDNSTRPQKYRYQNFLQGLECSPYNLTILAPGRTLYLRVHKEATGALGKAQVRALLRVTHGRLRLALRK